MTALAAELRDVHRYFTVRGRRVVRALDGVDLQIAPGECVGLVGESGSGKSTLARILMGLDRPTNGSALLWGQDVTRRGRTERLRLRRKIGVVFQDPFSSLNPARSLAQIVGEPLDVHGIGTPAERRARVRTLLESVGIDSRWAERRATQLSGGQRQRIAIARAIALSPDLLIMDEPVSALDVSVQAQVLNVLADLRDQMGFAALFISHDLAVVRRVADTVAVMYLGQIVEKSPAAGLFDLPQHPYTVALMSSVSDLGADGGERILLQGDPPSPIDVPSGCRFHPRCFRAQNDCTHLVPLLKPVNGSVGVVACLHPCGREFDLSGIHHSLPTGPASAASGPGN